MGYQFVRIQTYSRKRTDTKGSANDILDEADRIPVACTHVENPQRPSLVYGMEMRDLRLLHERLTSEAVTESAGKLKKIRIDQQTLVTLVASYPDSNNKDGYELWERLTVKWAEGKYGDRLKTVVRHDDEAFPHLHMYVLPNDPSMRASALHPGVVAKEAAKVEAKAAGLDSSTSNRLGDAAYKKAMRVFQDEYMSQVGIESGLTRRGPGKRRLSREGWKAEQQQAHDTAKLIEFGRKAQKYAQHIDEKKLSIEHRENQVELMKNDFIKKEIKLNKREKDMEAEINTRASAIAKERIAVFKEKFMIKVKSLLKSLSSKEKELENLVQRNDSLEEYCQRLRGNVERIEAENDSLREVNEKFLQHFRQAAREKHNSLTL